MLSIRGIFKDGKAQPMEYIEGRENQPVIITFLEDEKIKADEVEDDWDNLIQLIKDCTMDTEINDLAHQHDHYLYGTSKKDE